MEHRHDPLPEAIATADIVQAIQAFGAAYHDVQHSLDALLTRLDQHDKVSMRAREALRQQLDLLQRSVDRRFDHFGRELDEHHDRLHGLAAEITALRSEAAMRLQDLEERLAALEAQPGGA
jgi:chromosome segregation ATPase